MATFYQSHTDVDAIFPTRATENSAAYDLYSSGEFRSPIDNFLHVVDSFDLKPFERILVMTGISISLPPNKHALVLSRSGLAFKRGLIVLNAPGLIDPDYNGEIGVILYNSSQNTETIKKGDRIAQILIGEHFTADRSLQSYNQGCFNHCGTACACKNGATQCPCASQAKTVRGTGGFGSTGR